MDEKHGDAIREKGTTWALKQVTYTRYPELESCKSGGGRFTT